MIPCAPLFQAEADAAMAVFRGLQIVDVAGSPTIGQSCRPWMMDFAEIVFGAYDANAGRRLIREFFLLVSKKNTKSTIAAAIMLTALIRNWRRSAEFLILAPTIEIAKNSFNPARDMINADPELSALLHVQENVRTITHRNTGAVLKIVAADNETVSGKKATGVLVDELWLFGKRANADNMLREATGGLASRPEGFTIFLSTQSDEPPAGVFKAKLDRYRDIRDGKIADKRSLGVLYEFPAAMVKAEQHLLPESFHITNPNFGLSVDREYLTDEFIKAKQDGQGALASFAAKHLNIEIGMGLRSNRWPGAEFWIRRASPRPLTFDDMLDRCEVITAGNDGGGLDDLNSLCLLGREKSSERENDVLKQRWLAWSHSWCHESVLDRRKSIASTLLDFKAAGELTIADDDLGDIEAIVALLAQVKDAGLLAKFAVDPAGLGEMISAAGTIGVTQENEMLIGVPQGYGLMSAIKTTERKLARGTLIHLNSSCLNWAVGNLKIEPMATAIRATKQNAGDAKIDPVMALFDAVVPMSLNPEPARTGSVYEKRGLRML